MNQRNRYSEQITSSENESAIKANKQTKHPDQTKQKPLADKLQDWTTSQGNSTEHIMKR